MKNILIIVFTFLSYISVFGQVNWTKYINNPVFTKGPAFYDVVGVGQPTVLLENDTIKMWYSAVGGDMKSRIGYAYSTDGINWTKHTDMVINTGYNGEWDSKWLDTPEILKVDSGYLLYYYGDSMGYDTTFTNYEAVTHSAIGVAFSTDGINWTKEASNPVFTKGNVGEWDATWVESPALYCNDTTGELLMWYNGVDTTTWKLQIGLATSPDGINWTKYVGNPVIQTGNMGTYDDMWMGTPAVIYKIDQFEMWYSSASSLDFNASTYKFDTLRICYAKSDDGINWIKHQDNPLFNTGTSPYNALIDDGGPWAPDIIYDTDSNQYKMWFEAAGGFLLATSPYTVTEFTNLKQFDNELNIYPNPSSGVINIDAENIQKIELIDMNGKQIYIGNEIKLDLRKNTKGIYLIKVITQHSVFVNKVILE